MKILMVGVCDKPESTNTFMMHALENLGHEVYAFNYRTILEEVGYYTMNTRLLRHVLENQYDSIIFCKVDTVYPDVIAECSKVTKTVYWFMDPIQTAINMDAVSRASKATIATATCKEVTDLFSKYGAKYVAKYREGVDITLYKPKAITPKYDIVFFGSNSRERSNYIKYLLNNNYSVHVVGTGWGNFPNSEGPVYNVDLMNLINSSRIILNFVRSNSYSDRILISLACGAFVLSEYCSELDSDFKIGKHLDSWYYESELITKLNYYLSHENKRSEIAANGLEFARQFSWEEVMRNLVKDIERV